MFYIKFFYFILLCFLVDDLFKYASLTDNFIHQYMTKSSVNRANHDATHENGLHQFQIQEASFLSGLKQRLLSFIVRGIWNEEDDPTMVSCDFIEDPGVSIVFFYLTVNINCFPHSFSFEGSSCINFLLCCMFL